MISGSDSNKFLAIIWRIKEVLNEREYDNEQFVRITIQKLKDKFDSIVVNATYLWL